MEIRLKILSLLLLISQAASLKTNHSSRSPRLVGGRPTTSWKEFNFIVAIVQQWSLFRYRQFCAGSLIHSNLVLTAAHCFVNNSRRIVPLTSVFVIAGSEVWAPPGLSNFLQVRRVSKLLWHPDFKYIDSRNDIAVLVLNSPLKVDGEKVGLIAPNTDRLEEGTDCTVAGWGRAGNGRSSLHLQSAAFELYPKPLCRFHIGIWNMDPILCAHTPRRTGSVCSGDSGGPMVCNGKLAGIVSSSGVNCTTNFPSVFVDVAFYSNWIEAVRFANGAGRALRISALVLSAVFAFLLVE